MKKKIGGDYSKALWDVSHFDRNAAVLKWTHTEYFKVLWYFYVVSFVRDADFMANRIT